jgi:hypothetical protein
LFLLPEHESKIRDEFDPVWYFDWMFCSCYCCKNQWISALLF